MNWNVAIISEYHIPKATFFVNEDQWTGSKVAFVFFQHFPKAPQQFNPSGDPQGAMMISSYVVSWAINPANSLIYSHQQYVIIIYVIICCNMLYDIYIYIYLLINLLMYWFIYSLLTITILMTLYIDIQWRVSPPPCPRFQFDRPARHGYLGSSTGTASRRESSVLVRKPSDLEGKSGSSLIWFSWG